MDVTTIIAIGAFIFTMYHAATTQNKGYKKNDEMPHDHPLNVPTKELTPTDWFCGFVWIVLIIWMFTAGGQ